MGDITGLIDQEIHRLTTSLMQQQQRNGSWHFCFENGTSIDAYIIILFRTLNVPHETLIQQLHDRILAAQLPEGFWKLFDDEEAGNLSATADAYYALLYSGYSQITDEPIQRAKRYILAKGGLGQVTSLLSKVILAVTGQSKWPRSITSIPLEIVLFPASFPINLFEFSGYSRIHLIPMLIMADRQYSIKTADTPDLSYLYANANDNDEQNSRSLQESIKRIQACFGQLIGTPGHIHEVATEKAEQFMLQRVESDGTLYSYATSTILMIFALLALEYDRQHPFITHAIEGLTAMQYPIHRYTTIQNSPSTIWDTALITYALQEAGVSAEHTSIQRAASYLLSKQQHKLADWSIHNPNALPGGWGFSETNTINPDVDDTAAALRAIKGLSRTYPAYRESWNLGLQWVLSMQNEDGGWPAFEKNTNNELLTWLAIEGAQSSAIDPSIADLTGRTLEYLGEFAGFTTQHQFIKHGTNWLIQHQKKDGSWYGRWGICYIYGTWAALTGLTACGIPANHEAVLKGTNWIYSIQNADGGWGESCQSDRLQRYVPLGISTPSQTAWALDTLIASQSTPTAAMKKGISTLINLLHEDKNASAYPTGAGLPGYFYIHYHSYRFIWPLLALSHYRKKYED